MGMFHSFNLKEWGGREEESVVQDQAPGLGRLQPTMKVVDSNFSARYGTIHYLGHSHSLIF